MSTPTVTLIIDGVNYTCTPTPLTPPTPTPTPPPDSLVLLPAGITPTIYPLNALTNWIGVHDGATSGTAVGKTAYPVSVGGRTDARQFTSTFTGSGGFRWSVTYDNDISTDHFIYAGDLFFDSVAGLAQMELDNNQVTADGKTYIFGCQANANDGKWDITKAVTGSQWVASSAPGNPQSFPLSQWLHFEIMAHRDNAGNITYDSIYFNGTTYQIGVTLPAALKLGWAIGTLLVNFQLGGSGSGSVTAYASGLEVAKW
jgi:hypothetical protein